MHLTHYTCAHIIVLMLTFVRALTLLIQIPTLMPKSTLTIIHRQLIAFLKHPQGGSGTQRYLPDIRLQTSQRLALLHVLL